MWQNQDHIPNELRINIFFAFIFSSSLSSFYYLSSTPLFVDSTHRSQSLFTKWRSKRTKETKRNKKRRKIRWYFAIYHSRFVSLNIFQMMWSSCIEDGNWCRINCFILFSHSFDSFTHTIILHFLELTIHMQTLYIIFFFLVFFFSQAIHEMHFVKRLKRK